jgi:hypothetical protein
MRRAMEIFKTTRVWVVEFMYDGRLRHWYKAIDARADAQTVMAAQLHEVYGGHAQLRSVRLATPEEEGRYLRDELPSNAYCPTGLGGKVGDDTVG